jgi:hypothetical protein
MSRTTFDALPPGSKIWVLASDRASPPGELARLGEKVMGAWDKKQPLLGGCFQVVDDHFLIVGADQSRDPLDGCTVDAMMHWVHKLEEDTGLRLTDRTTVWYRSADGTVRSSSRGAFRKAFEAGEITEDTPVFDTAVARVEALRERRFEVPLAACWHAQIVGLPAASANR